MQTESYDVRYKIKREHFEESVPEILEQSEALSCRKSVLVADVPHAEKSCRNQCDYYDDHDSLQVNGISDVRTFACYRSRNAEKSIERVNAGVKESRFAAPFEKARLLSCIF